MDHLARRLRAAAEPTRLRLLALAARGAFCVMEFTEILGQSQPRLSRHLKLLCDAGLLERVREGANVWFALPGGDRRRPGARPARAPARKTIRCWRPTAARPPACWPNAPASPPKASGARAPTGTRCAPSTCPPQAVEAALLRAGPARRRRPPARYRHRHRPGAGTARPAGAAGAGRRRQPRRCWRWPAPAWPAPGSAHCAVRLADMYRLPLPDASFDLAVLQMVLHYAEDPAGVLAEAARVLRPGGRLIVIDLARARPRRRHRSAWRIAGPASPTSACNGMLRRRRPGARRRRSPSRARSRCGSGPPCAPPPPPRRPTAPAAALVL